LNEFSEFICRLFISRWDFICRWDVVEYVGGDMWREGNLEWNSCTFMFKKTSIRVLASMFVFLEVGVNVICRGYVSGRSRWKEASWYAENEWRCGRNTAFIDHERGTIIVYRNGARRRRDRLCRN
jgi:hypothetical protein